MWHRVEHSVDSRNSTTAPREQWGHPTGEREIVKRPAGAQKRLFSPFYGDAAPVSGRVLPPKLAITYANSPLGQVGCYMCV